MSKRSRGGVKEEEERGDKKRTGEGPTKREFYRRTLGMESEGAAIIILPRFIARQSREAKGLIHCSASRTGREKFVT